MTEQTAARVAPPADEPQLTEHVHVLMTPHMRAFLLGSKVRDGARSVGAVARGLLEDAITAYADQHPAEYELRIELGRGELARRAEVEQPNSA